MPEDVDHFQNVAIFAGLRPETLEFLQERAVRIAVAEGEDMLHEASIGQELFVLESGRAEVIKERGGSTVRLATVGPGDCFGEMELLAVMPRSATVRALEPCVGLRLAGGDLFALYKRDPEQFAILIMNMGREVARRLWAANEVLFGYATFLEPGP